MKTKTLNIKFSEQYLKLHAKYIKASQNWAVAKYCRKPNKAKLQKLKIIMDRAGKKLDEFVTNNPNFVEVY